MTKYTINQSQSEAHPGLYQNTWRRVINKAL